MLNLKELAIKRDNISLKVYNEFNESGRECCLNCAHFKEHIGLYTTVRTCELHSFEFDNLVGKCEYYKMPLRFKRAIKRISKRSLLDKYKEEFLCSKK